MSKARKNRLKELRAQSKLTQEEVATLTGQDFTTISRHESRDRGLTEKDIEQYCKVFKVNSADLFIDPVEFKDNTKK